MDIIEDKTKRIFAGEESLLFFSLYYFSHYHSYSVPNFHREWYEALQDPKLQGQMFIGFRESAKTSLVKIKVIHDILYNKKKFIIWTSKDKRKAEANLFDIALELQTNKRIINDFGQLFYEDNMNNEKYSKKKGVGEFITTNKIKVKSYSTGQSPRGEVYREFRPDLVVLDDYENIDTIKSDAYTSEVIHYIDELLSGLSGNAQIISLSNRLTFGGSVTYLENRVKEFDNWKIFDVPVVKDGIIQWKDKYVMTDKEAEEVNATIEDPAKWKVSLEAKERLLGYQVYNREMLNTPLTEEEIEFKKSWYMYRTRAELETMRTRKFLSIDTAISEKESADFTGVVECEIDREGYWNISANQYKLNPKDLVDFIITKHAERDYEAVGIEKTTFTEGLKPYLQEKMRERGIYIPIKELKHGGTQKETRIRGLIPRYSNRSVYHIVDECEVLQKQQQTFPKCEHDDVLDAEAYLLQLIGNTSDRQPQQFVQKINPGSYKKGYTNFIK